MTISDIEVVPLEVPLARTFQGSYYSMNARATLITRIVTEDGLVGEAYNGDEVDDQIEIARIITEEILPRLRGSDPGLVEACWQKMLPLTYDILRDRRLVLKAIASVDTALWDLAGKAMGTPLFRVWGGAWRGVAGLASAYGVEMVHHEEPQVSSHLLASISHGTYVEVFHPDRDPILWNLIANRPAIADGMFEVPAGPGLGLELDAAFIERYRVDRG